MINLKFKKNSVIPSYLKKSVSKKETNQAYYRFNQQLLLIIFLILATVAGFNGMIDPYGIFRTAKWQGLNQDKPHKYNKDRLFKATDIIHLKPTTILMGSSRMRQGIDPEHPLLKSDLSAYNLGLNGSNVYEIRQYLEHSLVNNPNLKQVIIGIDFFMFNGEMELQEAFDESRLKKTYIVPQDLLNTLLSFTALSDSKETILSSLNKQKNAEYPNYGDNGFLPYRNPNLKQQKRRFEGSIRQYLAFHNQYSLSPEQLQEFQKIVNICQENGIDLKVFISPSHAIQWESIAVTGEWDTFEQWKREIVKIYPVWDFSGYNRITTETLNSKMKNYTDSSHYTPPVGDLIINRLFNHQVSTDPGDFGVFITPDNIEQHIKNTRLSRQNWQKNNPQEQELVKQTKQDFDQKSNP